MDESDDVMVVTADGQVRDAVEAAAAALGRRVRVVAAVADAVACWPDARVVLVGGDRAAALASVAPPRRPRVHLIGFDPAELGTWSMPLGAEVVPLPQGLAWLTSLLVDEPEATSLRVAVVGGCGGVGASTLACGIALAASARGRSVALVDLDPLGGGLDLLLGAERAPGWRWPRLVGARGEVGDVRGVLPTVAGVTLVAMGREAGTPSPGAEPVHAVLGALGRHHEVVVIDAGRQPLTGARAVVRGADASVLVCGTGVREVAAAAAVRDSLDLADAGLVTAQRPGGTPGVLVAEALALPWWAELPRDRRLRADAEAGEAPWRPRSRWGRAVGRVVDRIDGMARDDR